MTGLLPRAPWLSELQPAHHLTLVLPSYPGKISRTGSPGTVVGLHRWRRRPATRRGSLWQPECRGRGPPASAPSASIQVPPGWTPSPAVGGHRHACPLGTLVSPAVSERSCPTTLAATRRRVAGALQEVDDGDRREALQVVDVNSVGRSTRPWTRSRCSAGSMAGMPP